MRVKGVVFLFLLIFICFVGWFSFSKIFSSRVQLASMMVIPKVSVQILDNSFVPFSQLFSDGTNILIYFNTTCPICQSEANLLVRNFQGDSSVNFIWVSSEKIEILRDFENINSLKNLPRYVMVSDTLFQIANHYKFTSVPATIVYSNDYEFVSYHLGAVSISDIKLAISKANGSIQ